MGRMIDTQEYLNTALDLIAQGKDFIPVPITGTSMTPFLHEGDTVFLSPLPARLKPGQILLHVRKDGKFVLHRIQRIESNSTVFSVGDRQSLCEAVDIPSQAKAIVTRANRNGRLINARSPLWLFYAYLWRWLFPIRQTLLSLVHTLRG